MGSGSKGNVYAPPRAVAICLTVSSSANWPCSIDWTRRRARAEYPLERRRGRRHRCPNPSPRPRRPYLRFRILDAVKRVEFRGEAAPAMILIWLPPRRSCSRTRRSTSGSQSAIADIPAASAALKSPEDGEGRTFSRGPALDGRVLLPQDRRRRVGRRAFATKRAIDEGRIPGPRIYPSGSMISQTSGHGDFRQRSDIPCTSRNEESPTTIGSGRYSLELLECQPQCLETCRIDRQADVFLHDLERRRCHIV